MALWAQRYQKCGNFSAHRWRRALAIIGMPLALAGCSGASAPAQSAQAQAQAAPAALTPPPGPDLRGVAVPPEARQAVIDARAALEQKDWARLGEQRAAARGDAVLGEYPAYWWLRQQLHDSTRPVPEADITEFLDVSTNAYLVQRLKGDWIVAAVRGGNAATALAMAADAVRTPAVDCALLQARAMQGDAQVTAHEALAVFRPGMTCWTMLDELIARQIVGFDALVPALRALLEAGSTAPARRMAANLFDGAQMVQYTALLKNPRKWLAAQGTPRSAAQIELVTLALSRLAREKDRVAQAAWVEKQWQARLPAANIAWVWSQFALVAVLNGEAEAARWYRRSGDGPMTDYSHAWQVRAELRAHPIDWAQVQQAIGRMSTRQAHEPVWMYWQGRALQAQGRHEAAMQQYAAIANDLGFYGQLANEELGHAPFIPALPAPVTAAELENVRARPGLQRALALFDLGWRPQAVREWVHAVAGLDDRLLHAAAELAREEHLYDRVVNTSLLTRDEIDFTQRFIAPFEDRVAQKAQEVALDPAWVYGLIRQESRFIMDARSRVGASGLMQLMPATAKWVAGKIGLKAFTPASVNDFDTNTLLGTRYLRMVLDGQEGSELLASAGYNAGPGRSRQWRARLAAPVEGAIFAETIPFTETRLYVKNVMSNAVYYGMMFSGEPQSLKDRLGEIRPPAVASR